MTFIFVRYLSRKGRKLCALGWISFFLLAFLPYHQPWLTVLLAIWAVVGRIALRRYNMGRELLTNRGFMQWFGLSVIWPLALKANNDLFATSEEVIGQP